MINHLLNLYHRREAAALRDDPHRLIITRARVQTERVAPGFRGSSLLGVPTFLLGGAVLSTVIGTLQAAALAAFQSTAGKIIAIVVLFGILLGLSWSVLKGAAIARRRIKLTVEQPLAAPLPNRGPLRRAAARPRPHPGADRADHHGVGLGGRSAGPRGLTACLRPSNVKT